MTKLPASPDNSPKEKDLSPAAIRALEEAAERRAIKDKEQPLPVEIRGRKKGLEPVRYGDWEKNGLAIDF